METLFVLWLYFAAPWSFHGVPMTPGWASVAVLNAEVCHLARLTAARGRPALCLRPRVFSLPQPLALPQLPRRSERQEDTDGVSAH